LPLGEIQTRLDPAEAVVLYHLGRDITGAWVVSHDELSWIRLEPRPRLEQVIHSFRAAVDQDPTADRGFWEAAHAAYRSLIQPFVHSLGDKKRLTIVPDGPLFGLPFEAMLVTEGPLAGRFLLEGYTVSYSLSLRPRSPVSKPNHGARLLLVGNPVFPQGSVQPVCGERGLSLAELPGSQREIAAIERLVGPEQASIYTREAARKEILGQDLKSFRIIHLATHGVVSERVPWESCLVFSGPQGAVSLAQLTSLRLNADLVVLSACESAKGQVLAGEGLWGFAPLFLTSGAHRVVASLWRVDDQATADFMEAFYRAMAPNFSVYGPSLRAAKLELLKHPRWGHPYYWAAFVLYGDVGQ
jgi:CHAT domain-containing protein